MATAFDAGGVPTEADFHEAISTRSNGWFAACLRITRNHGLAEDAVQEALMSAWHKRSQFHHSATLESWIHRIAVNAALQLIRKERPGRFQPLTAEMVDEEPSPEQVLQDGDIDAALTTALRRLSDLERVCFVLKHMEQWRLTEIADELGTDVGSVKQALFRAVKKLRVSMRDIESVRA